MPLFDDDSFLWEEGEEKDPFANDYTIYMVEVADNVHTPAPDGLYLNSAQLIAWIEHDINLFEESGMEDEASSFEDFLTRLRLLIANRGPTGDSTGG